MRNKALGLACIHLAVAIILGALGAHKLEDLLSPDKLDGFKTGVQYHIYHAFALLIVNGVTAFTQLKGIKTINWLFNLGILLFSGSIYLLSTLEISHLEGLKVLGPVTPIGGLLFIIGWVCLSIKFFSGSKAA